MLENWNILDDEVQLSLSREALKHASETIADQAETIASEMESGILTDRGGPDALRLLAAVVRVNGEDVQGPIGTA